MFLICGEIWGDLGRFHTSPGGPFCAFKPKGLSENLDSVAAARGGFRRRPTDRDLCAADGDLGDVGLFVGLPQGKRDRQSLVHEILAHTTLYRMNTDVSRAD